MYAGKNVEVFYPAGITSPKPTIFYSHPYGGEESSYNIGLYEFIAKKGYVVVFAPYPTTGVSIDDRYNTLWQSFRKAVTDYPNIIDTTKVGFMGHSFGGGASFGLGYKGFVENGWGKNGRVYFCHGPMVCIPGNYCTIAELSGQHEADYRGIYDDVTNDHRLAIDIFKTINIPMQKKILF